MVGTEKINRIFKHDSESSKFLAKLVLMLFLALQMIAGFMFSNFYGEFKDLEQQVNVLDHRFEQLRIEFNVLMTGTIQDSSDYEGAL